MTFDVHSKLLLPIFASPKLKKDVEKRNGTKKAGAETMIHAFQQAMIQSPDFDLSSADAIKASKISSAMKRWSSASLRLLLKQQIEASPSRRLSWVTQFLSINLKL